MSHSPIEPSKHKQLFLDEHAVASMSGVKRALHQPVKQGPVLKGDRTRGQTGVQSRSAPQWNSEKGIWEWWYWAYYDRRTDDRLNHYATSPDGVNWEAPSLGLYKLEGSVENNVAWDPQGRSLYHVLRDELDGDPQRRYKAHFDLKDRWIGLSADGFAWKMADVPPVPSQDESHLTYDEISGLYVATVKHQTRWGRSVWLSTSKDFLEWTRPELVFHTDETDNENRKRRIQEAVDNPEYLSPPIVKDEGYVAQVYQMAVMPYEGIYVGFPCLYNPAGPDGRGNNTGLNQVELTVSRDLRKWDRVADRAVFLGIDPWDGVSYGTAQKLLSGRPILRDGKEIWVYYNACRFRAFPEQHPDLAEYFNDKSALCLAKLRLDGFVSLDADGQGSVTTSPFKVSGESLFVNVDAPRGQVRAEVLDADTMAPLPGFSVSESNALNGDHLSGRMTWRGQPTLASDRPVRARFDMKGAQLYAFWLES